MADPAGPEVHNEVRRLLDALRTAIRLSGVSHRQIERDLAMSTGYLTRILAGQVQLRLTHVLSILQVIDLSPGSFFAALYPGSTAASGREARLTRGLAELHPEPSPTGGPESLVNELRVLLERFEGRS